MLTKYRGGCLKLNRIFFLSSRMVEAKANDLENWVNAFPEAMLLLRQLQLSSSG